MGILIGMDEAGYGPNFGPLVVAATAWHVHGEDSASAFHRSTGGEPASAGAREAREKNSKSPAGTRDVAIAVAELEPSVPKPQPPAPGSIDLYRLLRNIVTKTASERRLAIADSKVLYSPGAGLRQLERGLHVVLRSIGQMLSCWSEIVEYCGADPDGHHQRACWPDGFNCPLPVDADGKELSRLEARFTRACDAAGVRPLFIRARLIFPAKFNDLVDYYGTKGAALSHITVGLLREVMDTVTTHDLSQSPVPSPQPPIYALCDKHGGRNFYAALLQHHFSEHWIEPVFEGHVESRYEWGPVDSRTCVSFRMQGERFLPTALASMTAKYLRELSMRAFNEFWCTHIPDLRPTAGYPTDARRFKNDIATKQRTLGIDDHVLWRNK